MPNMATASTIWTDNRLRTAFAIPETVMAQLGWTYADRIEVGYNVAARQFSLWPGERGYVLVQSQSHQGRFLLSVGKRFKMGAAPALPHGALPAHVVRIRGGHLTISDPRPTHAAFVAAGTPFASAAGAAR